MILFLILPLAVAVKQSIGTFTTGLTFPTREYADRNGDIQGGAVPLNKYEINVNYIQLLQLVSYALIVLLYRVSPKKYPLYKFILLLLILYTLFIYTLFRNGKYIAAMS
jgi:hypothetical protein